MVFLRGVYHSDFKNATQKLQNDNKIFKLLKSPFVEKGGMMNKQLGIHMSEQRRGAAERPVHAVVMLHPDFSFRIFTCSRLRFVL